MSKNDKKSAAADSSSSSSITITMTIESLDMLVRFFIFKSAPSSEFSKFHLVLLELISQFSYAFMTELLFVNLVSED